MSRCDSLFSRYTLIISLIFISVAPCSYGADSCAAAPAYDESEQVIDVCGICLEELTSETFPSPDPASNASILESEIPKILRLTTCGHKLHTECLAKGKWQREQLLNCPLCRVPMSNHDHMIVSEFGLLKEADPYTLHRLTLLERRMNIAVRMILTCGDNHQLLLDAHNILGQRFVELKQITKKSFTDAADAMGKWREAISYSNSRIKTLTDENVTLRAAVTEISARLQSIENGSCKVPSSKTRKRKFPIPVSAAADLPTFNAEKENADAPSDQAKKVLRSARALADSSASAAAAAAAVVGSIAPLGRTTQSNKS